MLGLFIKRHAEVAAAFADVAVLYLRSVPEKHGGYHIEKTITNGVDTNIVYYETGNVKDGYQGKLLAAYYFLRAFWKGYRFLLETWGEADIIHVNVLTRLGIMALWLRFFKGKKYVITEHWSRYLPLTGTYNGFLRKLATWLVVKYADAFSTVSLNLAKAMHMHGLGNKNFLVLPNVVDTEAYVPAKDTSRGETKRFIHISCFEDRSKNISGLLRVISKLNELRSDFECIMVGEGIDFQKMKVLANDLRLKEPILKFTGLLEDGDVVKAYQSADFMVMFSNYENMPVVISESFACGLPVVATSVGGIPEYVTNDNGRLVTAGDETALLGAINYMLDNSRNFDHEQIRRNAVEIFGKQGVTVKLRELYGHAKHLPD